MKHPLLSIAVPLFLLIMGLPVDQVLAQVDCDNLPPSALVEPPEVFEACQKDLPSGAPLIVPPTDAFYVWNNTTINPPGLYNGVLATPDVLATVRTDPSSRGNFACEFPVNDFSLLYCIDNTGRSFYSYNTTTGDETIINFGGSVPVGSDTWTGMATDPTTGVTYATSVEANTTLYTIDLATGFPTFVATLDTADLVIDIAFDLAGQLYAHDTGDDAIYTVNKVTGAATFLGLTGFDANFAQGMDLDDGDGTIYASVYLGGGDNRLMTVNKLTGVFNEIGQLGSTFPGAGFETEIAIAATSVLLPIELAEFSATAIGRSIRVEWMTASETDNAGFDVLISSDGESFMSRGYVEGAGTTTEPTGYVLEIDALNFGKNYVRLKQVDLDGTFSYSRIVEVATEVPDGFVLEPAYPNPFNPATSIRFVLDSEAFVTLDVFDAQGRHVTRLFEGSAPAQTLQSVTFDASGLPGGLYFYRLMTPAGNQTRSVMLVK